MVYPNGNRPDGFVEEHVKVNGRSARKDSGKDSSGGKHKSDAKIARIPSNASFSNLSQSDVDESVVALDQMAGILLYANRYRGFLGDVQAIHGHYIEQRAEIERLRGEIETMTFFSSKETERLLEENKAYKLAQDKLENDRADLNSRVLDMDTKLAREESKMKKEMKKELEEIRKAIQNDASAKMQVKTDQYEKIIEGLKRDLNRLEKSNQILNDERDEVKIRLTNEVNDLKCDQRACRTRIRELERDIDEIRALSPVICQSPGF